MSGPATVDPPEFAGPDDLSPARPGGSALASVRWTAAGNLLRSILATVQLLVIARLVSVPEFGLIILVTLLMLLVQQISDAGLSTALIRFRDVTDEEKSSLYWLNVAIGIGMAGMTVLAAPAVAAAFQAPELVSLLQIASIVLVAQGFYLQLRVLAERDLRFGAVIRLQIAASCVGFVVAVGLASIGWGALSVVWGQVASSLTLLGLSWRVLARGWRPRLRFRRGEGRRFLAYGFDMLGVNLATSLTVQFDILIAGLLFPKETFGSFSQPRDLSLKAMTAVNPVITRVGLPLMAEHQADPAQAGCIYLRLIRMSATVCFPIYAGMALLAPDLLPALLGEQWTEAAALMAPIALWFALRSVINPLGSYMYAMGRSRLALWYQIAFAVIVGGAALGGALVGPVTLALAMAAAYLLFSEVCWAAVLRPISDVGFAAYHRQIFAPGAATLLAAAAFVGTDLALTPSQAALPASIVLGSVAFLVASFVLNRTGLQEVLALLGRSGSRGAAGVTWGLR